jgi:hypothetical protein
LSLALKRSQVDGLLTGIKVSRLIKILHLLFVDDILIMTIDSIAEWKEISRVLNFFCNASGLQINPQKTTFLQYGVRQHVLDSLKTIFPFNFQDLFEGFRYLGFFLKIDRYKTEDWHWLVEKYEKRISHWCNLVVVFRGVIGSDQSSSLRASLSTGWRWRICHHRFSKKSANLFLVSFGRDVEKEESSSL